MPTVVTNGGRARTIGATFSGVTKRGVFSTKMKPSASAPASTAVIASSRLVMPQILTRVIDEWGGRDAPPISPPARAYPLRRGARLAAGRPAHAYPLRRGARLAARRPAHAYPLRRGARLAARRPAHAYSLRRGARLAARRPAHAYSLRRDAFAGRPARAYYLRRVHRESTRVSSLIFAGMSAARTRPSPTRIAWAPATTTRRTSAAVKKPLSLTTIGPSGISGRSSSVVAIRVSNVARSRLLIPMMRLPTASAWSTSVAVWHSTSAARPSPFAAASSSASRAGSRIETIRSTASAPAARDSQSWYSSIVKSLRKSGTSTAARTRRRSSRLPWKYFSSVRTEIAWAPWLAYVVARATGSRPLERTPRDGEAFFTSAIRRTDAGDGRSAPSKSRGAAAASHCRSSAARGTAAFRRATSARVLATISSRTDIARR